MATANIYDLADTWNNVATTYTAIKMNVTDTASASGSLLLDLQVGGSSRITIRKDGFTQLNGTSASLAASSCGVATNGPGLFTTGTNLGGYLFGASNDLFLTRKAAASLRLGAADAASPVAQTLGVQSVVAGTTNTAGANFTIAGSQGTGTGAGGSIVFQVAPAGSSGTAQNGLMDALTIDSTRSVYIERYFRTRNNIFAILDDGNSILQMGNNVRLGWTVGGAYGPSSDTILQRDAANTLALRNGSNAQAFRVYNTYTDASNYERGFVKWDTNVLKIGTEKLGTGTARALELQTDGTTRLTIATDGGITIPGAMTLGTAGFLQSAGSYTQVGVSSARYVAIPSSVGAGNAPNSSFIDYGSTSGAIDSSTVFSIRRASGGSHAAVWTFNSSGHFLAATDNTYDIGASGATRPRDLFVGGGMTTGAPTGGTAAKWKLGTVATVSPTSPNRTIEVDIGGTIYYIHAKTTND